jgi:alkylation response protein AidB-like acyl-CoA dehydrogenase
VPWLCGFTTLREIFGVIRGFRIFASEVGFRFSNMSVPVHGGHGYTNEHPVERYLRDAKLWEIGEGTSQVQRLVISNALQKETYWTVPDGQKF